MTRAVVGDPRIGAGLITRRSQVPFAYALGRLLLAPLLEEVEKALRGAFKELGDADFADTSTGLSTGERG